jgi:hypothetical protein
MKNLSDLSNSQIVADLVMITSPEYREYVGLPTREPLTAEYLRTLDRKTLEEVHAAGKLEVIENDAARRASEK